MRRVLVLSFLFCALGNADWIRVASPNFVLLTIGPERDARRTLEIFEQAREFFVQTHPFPINAQAPVTVIAFDNARDYEPYQMRPGVLAYYLDAGRQEYILMRDLDGQRARIATHEYVHLLVRHSGLWLPQWLNEGLAEVYAGMEVRENRVVVGDLPSDRAADLGRRNWLPLATILDADANSSVYDEQTRAGMFYAQSCLLAHMLMLGEGFAPRFPEFVRKLSDTHSVRDALSEVYDRSIVRIEREMNTYFRGNTIGGAGFAVTLSRPEIGPARPATEVETGVALARVAARIGKKDLALARLRELDASNAEVAAALVELNRATDIEAGGRPERSRTVTVSTESDEPDGPRPTLRRRSVPKP